MPRPREFDESVALEKAMETFWRRGYEDTSYDDLVSATGVSRYGLYTAFGDKHEMFLKALDQYIEEKRCQMMGPLMEKGASLPAIHYYFDVMKKNIKSPESRAGCMFCNAALELSAFDQQAAERVTRAFVEIKKLMKVALSNAKKKGELKTKKSPEALSDFLLGLMLGATSMVRTPIENKQIIHYIDTGLAALE